MSLNGFQALSLMCDYYQLERENPEACGKNDINHEIK